MKTKTQSFFRTNGLPFSAAICAGVYLLIASSPQGRAQNPINFTGGNGAISFGVTPYGAPVPGVPTYIGNNFDGLNDVLSSPGGTFQTANPVVANNIASYTSATLPAFGIQVGGSNGSGAFGRGSITVSGPRINYSISDSAPGGGSASYGIASWNATFTSPTGYAGPFGTFLALSGNLPAINSSSVAALRTTITSANPASPFFGGLTLAQLVLADGRIGANAYSIVARGGSGAAVLNNGRGGFRGLAIDNINLVIPAGDVFTATSTLTIYGDPSSLDSLDPTTPDNADLVAATGASLPQEAVVSVPTMPQWATAVLAVLLVLVATRNLSKGIGANA